MTMECVMIGLTHCESVEESALRAVTYLEKAENSMDDGNR